VDLTLRRGETVFQIGGNGSGKSTLARLLTGLYRPEAGTIRVDGYPVEAGNWPAYRQLFATVFTDFYLFPQLLGPDGDRAPEEVVSEWLNELHLRRKARVRDGLLLDTQLSHGQRKRLALLLA